MVGTASVVGTSRTGARRWLQRGGDNQRDGDSQRGGDSQPHASSSPKPSAHVERHTKRCADTLRNAAFCLYASCTFSTSSSL